MVQYVYILYTLNNQKIESAEKESFDLKTNEHKIIQSKLYQIVLLFGIANYRLPTADMRCSQAIETVHHGLNIE